MDKKKVLIFPAGSEIAFEIVNALKYSKFVELYGGTSTEDHSLFVYKNLIKGFPYVNEEGFLAYLNSVIEEYGIDYVYPAHDSASVYLALHREEIKATVVISDKETALICRDKRKTYEFFEGESFIPRFFNSPEEVTHFPVFIKPAVGQGSVGAKVVNDREELIRESEADSSIVMAEYLPGNEYTVDCLSDRNGKLLAVLPRVRNRIKTGISVNSRSCPLDAEIRKTAEKINSRLSFKGAWFFQLKKDREGVYKLLEVSPRISGTMGLYRNRGINFPMLTLFVFGGYDVEVIDNGYDIVVDRAFHSLYRIGVEYRNIYIDYDDTITINGKINPDVIKFLYQSVNNGKKIYLCSRHKGDIYADMDRLHLDKGLFEKVIVLTDNQEKSDLITGESSIFIDDSFAERKKVKDKLGIPVFDVDMIESLIDGKEPG